MQQTDWEKLQRLFDEASVLSGEDRKNYLKVQNIRPSLLEELRELLEADDADNILSIVKNDHLITVIDKNGQDSCGNVHELEVGFLVGPYKIQEKIGMGGMGVIYRAIDTRLERQIALKFLLRYAHRDELAKRRFMQEARSASRLDHQNICAIYDINTTDEGYVYFTMPYYQGETLAARIAKSPLNTTDALDIAIQVSNGLVNAHGLGIVHRDIKPANIMLTEDDRVKILDFGIAKMANINLTATGDVIGTVAYMAPEQLKGEKADERVDVWALGLIFLEMLTGEQKFSSKKMQHNIKNILDENFSPLDSLNNNVNDNVRNVLKKALQQDQNKRYRTMSEFNAELSKIKNGFVNDNELVESKKSSGSNQWDKDTIDSLTECILPWMGPIASKLVQRYAAKAENIEELCHLLLDNLTDEEAKADFREKIKLILAKK